MTLVISGRTFATPFARYDHASRSWKTCPDISNSDSPESSPTLPKTGFMHDGCLYAPAISGHHTGVNASSPLLPTPAARDGRTGNNAAQLARKSPPITAIAAYWAEGDEWGRYTATIDRWTAATRPTPSVAEPNRYGRPRATARFIEWMMGLPAGHITDVPMSYGAHVRLLGNAVVPQQAEYALRMLIAMDPSQVMTCGM